MTDISGKIRRQEALDYHARGRRGKLEVRPSKPCLTLRDLALAHTPGAAAPCLAIRDDAAAAYEYTGKGNLVAVVSNGTAVLGLGDVGAAASKPALEGKAVLFKRFADIDVFDLEIDAPEPQRFVDTVVALAPTFGGVNLENVRAPACFAIEEQLEARLDLPVFHDDQHGTAIICGGALLNALEVAGKQLPAVRIVIAGAGAAGVACARFLAVLGADPENILLCDSRGLLTAGRADLNPYQASLARRTRLRTLAEAARGADVLIGVSVANVFTRELVASLAADPVLFALASPNPEIPRTVAMEVRRDLIMATSEADQPNHINHVLATPFIFRGALDVRARAIDAGMRVAAARALAALAREGVPDSVLQAYGETSLKFGPDYIVPRPFDPRVLHRVAPAVAEAAVGAGLARQDSGAPAAYRTRLAAAFTPGHEIMRRLAQKAQSDPRRIVLAEGHAPAVVRAARIAAEEGIARPVLLGRRERVEALCRQLDCPLDQVEIQDPGADEQRRERYAQELWGRRQRRGMTLERARREVVNHNTFGALMVELGDADGLVTGHTEDYADAIRPVLQVIPPRPGISTVSGLYLVLADRQPWFITDTTMVIAPTAEQLAEIALVCAERVRDFDVQPRVALLSFCSFGAVDHPRVQAVERALTLIRDRRPDLIADGPLQANVAVTQSLLEEQFPFARLKTPANLLVMPDLDAGNISYKLLGALGKATVIGPILCGLSRPVHVLERGCDVETIVHLAAVTVVDAQPVRGPGE